MELLFFRFLANFALTIPIVLCFLCFCRITCLIQTLFEFFERFSTRVKFNTRTEGIKRNLKICYGHTNHISTLVLYLDR